jgi:integrase
MTKNAYEQTTIKATLKRLRYLQANTLIADPEEVKMFVAKKQCSNAYKECLIETYALYMKALNREWKQPFYKRYEKPPKIPTEQRIENCIAKANPDFALILSMMKDLGTRPIELTWLTIGDINLETGQVSIIGAKHTLGRYGKLRTRSLEMLKAYIKKHNLNRTNKLLNVSSDQLTRHFCCLRSRLAETQQDPEYKNISLYDFRRFKATMEYHRTKDERYVRALLGHKDARALNRYIVLLQTIEGDEYIAKVATNTQQAKELVEAGFDYVTGTFEDGGKIFRKRK